MAQKQSACIPISNSLKLELLRRKEILSRRLGKSVSYDVVIRQALGM